MQAKGLVVALFLLFLVVAGHAGLYRLAVRALAPQPGPLLSSLRWGLLLGAFSFPLTALVVRTVPSEPTRWLFTVAASWFGLFVNLLLTALVAALVARLAAAAGRAIPSGTVAAATVVVAVVVSAVGFWRAAHPEVRTIDLAIPGLPPAWEGGTIVQVSDLHLGSVLAGGFMRRVAARVNAIEPDVVAITGDLFDGMGGDHESLVGAVDELRAKRAVLFVRGNHEGYNERRTPLGPIIDRLHATKLNDEVVDLDGLQFAGVTYPAMHGPDGRRRKERLVAALDRTRPSVLLFHTPTNVEDDYPDPATRQMATYWTPDTSCTVNARLGFSLQLSGHSHAGQFIPFTWLTRFLYGGRDYGLHRIEDMWLYTSSGTGTFGPPMRTGSRSEIVVFRLHGKADGTS